MATVDHYEDGHQQVSGYVEKYFNGKLFNTVFEHMEEGGAVHLV